MYYGYQARLIVEYDDLQTKVEKLKNFLGSDVYKTLEPEEQLDLQEQLMYMQNYLSILWKRLNRKGLI